MAARFGALARREKAVVEQEKNAKALLAQAEAEKAKYQPILDAIAKGKENPQAILDAAGVTLDQVIKFHVNNGKPTEEDRVAELERKLEADKAERKAAEEANRAAQLEAHKAYVERMINMYRDELKAHIASSPDDYELIIAHDAQDDVFSEIEEHFAKTGEILAPDVAAKQFEAKLQTAVEKALGLKKFAGRLKPVEPPAEESTTPPPQRTKVPAKTLSTTQVMSDPVKKRESSQSRDERLKAAAAKLQFTAK